MAMFTPKQAWKVRLVKFLGGQRHRTAWAALLLPVLGMAALVWFLLRVVPKPSRAGYPCQRVAAPLAGGFLLWIGGVLASLAVWRHAHTLWERGGLGRAVLWGSAAALAALIAWHQWPQPAVVAGIQDPLTPIGVGRGVHPGRVAWVHDKDATDWAGPGLGDGYWWEASNTDQSVVDGMMERVIRAVAGQPTNADAWDTLFRHFNQEAGKGDVGYTPGEKITIKVNFVGTIAAWTSHVIDSPDDYDINRVSILGGVDYMNTSPQMILALLKQLVNHAGVAEADILVGDPLCYFPNEYYDHCHAVFPNVRYWDYAGQFGRTAVQSSSASVHWSTNSANGKTPDTVAQGFVDATYVINMANLKSHGDQAGVTFTAKNHYGSLNRRPDGPQGHYSLHQDLPFTIPGMGHYRPLVDLIGHEHLGAKTMLFLIDGLYAGKHQAGNLPVKWNSAPFNGDWSNSLFASQDPIAIDSVAYDFVYHEWTDASHTPGTDDYLHEAALADNPPSGTFYDPNGGGSGPGLQSLGVHEHWNNETERLYSRNLGASEGIELVPVGPPQARIVATPTSGLHPLEVTFDGRESFDADGTITWYSWEFNGDDSPDASGAVVTQTYTERGAYVAKLTVTDNDGLTDSVTVTISVEGRPGDGDGDFDVDMSDYGAFQSCLAGEAVAVDPSCDWADLDGDEDVSTVDRQLFQNCFSGANMPSDPGCLP